MFVAAERGKSGMEISLLKAEPKAEMLGLVRKKTNDSR